MAHSSEMVNHTDVPAQQSSVKPAAPLNVLEATLPETEKMADDSVISIHSEETEVLDLFEPFPELPGQIKENDRVFTIRAMLVGSLLGCLVTASNTYLGL